MSFAACGDGRTGRGIATDGTLTLLREKNLSELLPATGRYEASGVALRDGALLVAFDNRTQVAEVDLALSTAKLGPGAKSASQYEGITIAARPLPRVYLVREIGAGGRGEIVTLDDLGNVAATEPTDIAFSGNKGLEGIAWLDDVERLLVLCEASACGAGDRRAGHGLVTALRHEGTSWVTEASLPLPDVRFDDYSDLAVLPEADGTHRIAVLSQESAALWLGTLTTRPLAILGPGVVYGFPKAADRVQYCSLEGVTFIDARTFAMASDRVEDAAGCTKGEALHVFALP
ncbi:MAG: hypothetical protein KF795_08605 [Labilithrix sp.]|nr:hypothetical protein [Labilithrix sp.]